MPRGIYTDLESGAQEVFQCAPGAGGWRYVSERSDGLRTDLTVDSRWRQIRVQVGWRDLLVRGGLVGRELLWIRTGTEQIGIRQDETEQDGTDHDQSGIEHSTDAAGFLGDSPAFLVAVIRSLRLDQGSHADLRLLRLNGPALATLTIIQRWRLAEITTYDTELAPLPVERYEVTDLATGETSAVHLAGDVVLDAPGIELTDLDTPPTLTQPHSS